MSERILTVYGGHLISVVIILSHALLSRASLHCIEIVQIIYQNAKSSILTQGIFRQKYGYHSTLSEIIIHRVVAY